MHHETSDCSITTSTGSQDAIQLLINDHRAVMQLFERFDEVRYAGGADAAYRKSALAHRICNELSMHAMLENEIFYPAVRSVIDDDIVIDHAQDDHAAAFEMMAQLKAMPPQDIQFDALVMILQRETERHITEEQEKLFPLAINSTLDMTWLGERMILRKAMLTEADFAD